MTFPGSHHSFPSSAGGSGALVNTVNAVVNFGAPYEDGTARVAVAALWATSAGHILAAPLPSATADHDVEDAAVEGLTVHVANVVAGVGFDLIAHAPGGTWGRYNVYATG